MKTLKIFVSHETKYSEIAKHLKLSLQALEAEPPLLDIKISEEMAGATDWRQWIEDNVKSADVFLLLYPHATMNMGWCNYELGRFYDGSRQVACIKNTDIPQPPPAFQPYQAYDADEAGLLKFIRELFVIGTFMDGKAVNAAVGRVTDPYYQRAKDVASELAQKFTEARIREHFYERRIVISIRYDDAQRFDAEASTVQGNSEGLDLLGFDSDSITEISWSAVRQSLNATFDWPKELEQALSSITKGALPPALSPFLKSNGIYIPVIAKAESGDGVVRSLVLIFVAAEAARLRPLLDWSLPAHIPDSFAFLVQLFRLMFRARWEILEPPYQEARFSAPSAERCAELACSVLADYDQMQRDAKAQGMVGHEQFMMSFYRDLRADVDAYSEEWVQLIKHLRTAPADNPEELSRQLKDLLDNNAKWLDVCARQLGLTITDQR
jgi:hypothetical protein